MFAVAAMNLKSLYGCVHGGYARCCIGRKRIRASYDLRGRLHKAPRVAIQKMERGCDPHRLRIWYRFSRPELRPKLIFRITKCWIKIAFESGLCAPILSAQQPTPVPKSFNFFNPFSGYDLFRLIHNAGQRRGQQAIGLRFGDIRLEAGKIMPRRKFDNAVSQRRSNQTSVETASILTPAVFLDLTLARARMT